MNLSDQVCDLVLAKKLKELGVVQQACFFWVAGPFSDAALAESGFGQLPYKWWPKTNWAAFTVAELGEMLPQFMQGDELSMHKNDSKNGEGDYYCLWYGDLTDSIGDRNEADARAKMLIHLIENNLIQL